MLDSIPAYLLIAAAILIVGLITAAWAFRQSRGLVTAIDVDGDGLVFVDRRGTHALTFNDIRQVSAVSIDRLGYESWGLDILTRKGRFYIDEDVQGFGDLLGYLAEASGFEADKVEAEANAALIEHPFKGFRHLIC